MDLQGPKQAIEGDDPNVPPELNQTEAQMQNGVLDPASVGKKLSDYVRNQGHAIAPQSRAHRVPAAVAK
jgi:hypothetical protein